MMERPRTERRSIIDRIRLSEFFALMCTAVLLLTLFLLSSATEPISPSMPISAGFPSRVVPAEPEIVEEEPVMDESLAPRIPSRSIDSRIR